MLVAVSVVSAHIEATHKRWKLEAHLREGQTELPVRDERFPLRSSTSPPSLQWRKESFRVPSDDPTDLSPAFNDVSEFGGLMYVLDIETAEEVWRSNWGAYVATPSGFCFDGEGMFVADVESSSILMIDMGAEPGRVLRRISHPALNDVHSVTRTRQGILVASTGTDMVIELGLDGRPLYQWWAGDHGFTTTDDGLVRLPQPQAEHRDQYYHTRYHTTHLNAACYRDAAETRLLVLLWRQGALVEIDVTRPPREQRPRVVVDGLTHPHTIRRLSDGGWMVVNSQGQELVILDRQGTVTSRIPSVPGWIQDALPLAADRWLIADVNNFRLAVQNEMGEVVQSLPFDRNWRVYGLNVVPDRVAGALLAQRLELAGRR